MWLPAGKYVWDFWFARRAGRLHVFYLQAEHEDCQAVPERRHDLASVGHAWEAASGFVEAPGGAALRAREVGAWDDLAIWTGSILEVPGAGYVMLYTSRSRKDAPVATPHEWQRPQHIGMATSRDLALWERSPSSLERPLLPNPGRGLFDGVSWRDPYLTWLSDGRCAAFICARLSTCTGSEGGAAVAMVTTSDLVAWSRPEVFATSDFQQMEVPQVFWRAGRCYVVFSAQARDCSMSRRRQAPDECVTGTYYLRSQPAAVGERPLFEEPARLLAAGLYGGKLVDPHDERPVFYGFPWIDGQAFGGGIARAGQVVWDSSGRLRLECE